MMLAEKFSLALLVVLLGTQLWLRFRVLAAEGSGMDIKRALRYAAIVAVLGISAIASYEALLLYRAWAAHPLSLYLLPPHASPSYFLGYIGDRFFLPYLLSAVSAVVFGYAMRYLNKRSGERFFFAEEPILAALAIFVAGYPSFLLLVPLVLISAVVLSILFRLLGRARAPLYYLWLPLAIIVILISNYVLPASFENFFRL